MGRRTCGTWGVSAPVPSRGTDRSSVLCSSARPQGSWLAGLSSPVPLGASSGPGRRARYISSRTTTSWRTRTDTPQAGTSSTLVRWMAAARRLTVTSQADVHQLKGIGSLAGQRSSELQIGDVVHKVGRTTGVRHGRVTAFELDGVEVEYDIGVISFDNQIEIEG